MALPKAFLPIHTEYLVSLKFEAPLGMLGNQVARFSEADLLKVLRRRNLKAQRELDGTRREKMSMANYMAVFGIQEYVDVELYGTPMLHLDLNIPMSVEYRRRFRSVADTGTLEHVMNHGRR